MCGYDIEAGEEYDRYVYVFGGKMWISKFHVRCPQDFWDKEDERNREAEAAYNEMEADKWDNDRAA